MLKKPGLYYRTIKYLKPVQIRYRLWYALRDKVLKLTGYSHPCSIPKKGFSLNLDEGITKPASLKNRMFTFLHQSQSFNDYPIDWNFNDFGKLWAYNLNYFDYLQQPGMTKELGLSLINEFVQQIEQNETGLEPYPVSLRGINWIKFLSRFEIQDMEIYSSLYAQFRILLDNLEYHLMGNHLLENGFSLFFGAFYFRDEEFYQKAHSILFEELEEQVLEDGGHFERSPMYHQILLEHLLDSYQLVTHNRDWKTDGELEELIREKAEKMLGWLGSVTFLNGDIPLVNDSDCDNALTTDQLKHYARELNLIPEIIGLKDSGYRMVKKGDLEVFLNVGKIGPDYQPGHSHSDTFSFVLYKSGKPVIIDPGISTYETSETRIKERSTSFHNTVEINGRNQSEIWASFRVGRRASVINLQEHDEGDNFIIRAEHDGYKNIGLTHSREWEISDDQVKITDFIKGDAEVSQKAYFHFPAYLCLEVDAENGIISTGLINLRFDGAKSIHKIKYNCPDGFNRYKKAWKAEIEFEKKLITSIT